MRCIALAQAWHDRGGRVVFTSSELPASIKQRLAAERFDLVDVFHRAGSQEDAFETAGIARSAGAYWVTVDGYQFDASYQRVLKESKLRMLFIDDYGHCAHYSADVVLNQNRSAEADLYRKRESFTQLLLGSRFVLLRREFRNWRDWTRSFPDIARRILVTLGGGDPDNVTLKVIQALQRFERDELQIMVISGSSNPHYDALESAVKMLPSAELRHATLDMPDLMAWADVAVLAGGSTVWESAFMGLPSLYLVLAENQAAIAATCDRQGAGISMGRHVKLSAEKIRAALRSLVANPSQRMRMSRAGRECVDGFGSDRVAEEMNRQMAAIQAP